MRNRISRWIIFGAAMSIAMAHSIRNMLSLFFACAAVAIVASSVVRARLARLDW